MPSLGRFGLGGGSNYLEVTNMNHESEVPSTWDKPNPRIYLQKYPSRVLPLYTGFGEIIYQDDGRTIEGHCKVKLEWFPSPSINIYFVTHDPDINHPLGEADLKLTELGLANRLKIYLHQSRSKGDSKSKLLIGRLTKPFYDKSPKDISSLVFYITNFQSFNICNRYSLADENEQPLEGWGDFYGQFVFQDPEWRIVLCTLDACWELQEKLESQGGYGITHICKLERTNKKPFQFEDAKDRIEAFIYYLSFARGLWIAPIMFAGYDESGVLTFEKWENVAKRTDPWRNESCWFISDSTELPDLFLGFLKLWSDETWREVLKIVLELFIESFKQSSGVSASIILQVTALERLGWAYLVNVEKSMSADRFVKLKTSDKIKRLLSSLKISLNLEGYDKHFPILFGRECLDNQNLIDHVIKVRNKIVHPPEKKPESSKSVSFDDNELEEVWVLGHDILMACLFSLIQKSLPESPRKP